MQINDVEPGILSKTKKQRNEWMRKNNDGCFPTVREHDR